MQPLKTYKRIATADTNAASITAKRSLLKGWSITCGPTGRSVKLYDKATAPTVGTDVPKLALHGVASQSINLSIPAGIQFDTGIALAITAFGTDADATAVAAGDVVLNLFYTD